MSDVVLADTCCPTWPVSPDTLETSSGSNSLISEVLRACGQPQIAEPVIRLVHIDVVNPGGPLAVTQQPDQAMHIKQFPRFSSAFAPDHLISVFTHHTRNGASIATCTVTQFSRLGIIVEQFASFFLRHHFNRHHSCICLAPARCAARLSRCRAVPRAGSTLWRELPAHPCAAARRARPA